MAARTITAVMILATASTMGLCSMASQFDNDATGPPVTTNVPTAVAVRPCASVTVNGMLTGPGVAPAGTWKSKSYSS
jgi:hypothetical protein